MYYPIPKSRLYLIRKYQSAENTSHKKYVEMNVLSTMLYGFLLTGKWCLKIKETVPLEIDACYPIDRE